MESVHQRSVIHQFPPLVRIAIPGSPADTFPIVAAHLEQGQRLENLSWRLWHLQNLMVDTDNAKSKREFKKLSKSMGERLDKDKNRYANHLTSHVTLPLTGVSVLVATLRSFRLLTLNAATLRISSRNAPRRKSELMVEEA